MQSFTDFTAMIPNTAALFLLSFLFSFGYSLTWEDAETAFNDILYSLACSPFADSTLPGIYPNANSLILKRFPSTDPRRILECALLLDDDDMEECWSAVVNPIARHLEIDPDAANSASKEAVEWLVEHQKSALITPPDCSDIKTMEKRAIAEVPLTSLKKSLEKRYMPSAPLIIIGVLVVSSVALGMVGGVYSLLSWFSHKDL